MVTRPLTVLRLAITSAALLTLAGLLILGVSPAGAGSWSIAVLGGGASDYFDDHFTALTQLAGERHLSGNLALRAETGYLGYRRPVYGIVVLRDPLFRQPTNQQTTQFLPVALGVRLYSPNRPEQRARGYLQLEPTLFWVWGAQRLTVYGRGLDHAGGRGWNDEPPTVTRQNGSFMVLRPGFLAGVGVRTRLGDVAHMEWGVRYLYSGRIGRQQLGSSSVDYAGLSTLAVVVGVGVTP
jgi:hypothetical protein